MKRKIAFSFLILVMLFSAFLTVPTQALFDEKECVLSMDMEQMFVLPRTGGLGTYQDTYSFDVSPYRNHGELLPYGSGTPFNLTDYHGPLKDFGYYGYALRFDGNDDYVQVESDTSLDLTTGLTISVWVNPDTLTDYAGIINRSNSSYVQYSLQVMANGTVRFGYNMVDPWSTYLDSLSQIVVDEWTYLTVTWYNNISIYIDGVLDISQSAPPLPSIDDLDVYIGVDPAGVPEFFDGRIDEIRFYPFVLTNAEIINDLNTPIDQYYIQDFVHYYNNVTWSEDPTAGMHGHYQGDPWCPWVNSDGVEDAFIHEDVQIHLWNFVPGFQQFRFRGTFLTNFTKTTGGGTRDGFDFHWYFFKDGLWTSYYRVAINRVKPFVGDDHQWVISIGYSPREGNYGHVPLIWVNTTQAGNDEVWDWTVDGFTSQDGSQFVIRVTSENKTHAWDLGYGEGWELDRYHVERRWDLVDADNEPQHIEYFDSFVGIDFKCSGRYKNGTVAVLSHRAGIIGNFIQRIYEVVKGVVDRFIVPVVKMVTSIELPSLPAPEVIVDVLESWKRGILDLPHKLFEGFTTVTTGIQKAFESLNKITNAISISLSTGLLLMWGTFVSFLDTVFTTAGFTNGFSIILSWISSFSTWMIDGITYATSLLLSTFEMMASWLSFAIVRFTSIADGFVNIYTVLVDIYTQAETGWISISSWLVPMLPLLPLALFIWIFSARNIEGMVKRITMLWDLLRTTIGFLIQIGQYVFTLITGLIELIPVAE